MEVHQSARRLVPSLLGHRRSVGSITGCCSGVANPVASREAACTAGLVGSAMVSGPLGVLAKQIESE